MDTYDYLVVGAGSAGCVVANRLTEDPNTRVCLIEAGPADNHPFIHVPAGMLGLFKHPRLNWRYSTTAQQHADDRSIYIPRGRVLGGSSSINAMVYMRGHPRDYDDWGAAGNAGWNYDEVLPYFRRSEHNTKWVNSKYHGTMGPMRVVDPDPINPLIEVFFAAAAAAGVPRTEDFNGQTQEGYGLRQLTQRDGRRESTATAFLSPIRGRRNLTILTDCLVNRIVFENRRAVGVELLQDGKNVEVRASREVVLCAGTIGSPVILNRSGVGDGEELGKHGIAVAHHLPGVGRNLQDHICVDVSYTSRSTVSLGISPRVLHRLALGVLEYMIFRRGFLTTMPMDSGLFFRSRQDLDRPDFQIIFAAVHRSITGRLGIGHGYGMTPTVLRPKSRGVVKLASADPAAAPVIDPQFFSEPDDLELLLHGVKFSLKLLADQAFDAHRGVEIAPGESVRGDDDLRRFIRASCHTLFHPVGTCKMGDDKDAVVDSRLCVHGIGGLRVVDASIMPNITGGNTNAPTIMIAEKASDMILAA